MTQTKTNKEGLPRPPVVAVLGHVDHGKTSILDRIRQTNLAAREAGGITQSIGASSIVFKDQKITFIDTPGHAAFGKMRQRGGQAADLVILVVAADDGVMPQTIESIEHIKAASVPFIVAINKIDLPGADVERVKKQLADNGVLLEGYGGDIVAVPISAKTGKGIDDLLEMILLVTQMEEISGDPEGLFKGIIIESKKDKAGPVGTIVVKNGTLNVGDQILAGEVWAKTRGLFDENWKSVLKVEPGEAAQVLGFETIPPVGASVIRVETSSERKVQIPTLQAPPLSDEEQKKFKIILRADTAGSLEAIIANLVQDVVLVTAGLGEILKNDVLLAQMTKAKIFGFRIKIPSEVAKLAEGEKVEIAVFDIIYQFLESLEKEKLRWLTPTTVEQVTGKAEILAEFTLEGKRIAGGRLLEGKISERDKMRLLRGEKILGEAQIISLKQRAKSVSEVKAKEEFGVLLEPPLDFKVGDMLISFRPA